MSEFFPFERQDDRFRVVMCVEYKGVAYHGWQVQRSGVPTIQATVEKAIAKVANEPVATMISGRTDAGVHASNQILHFDTKSQRNDYGWMMGVNGHLPDDISIRWVRQMDERFHARFSAKERAYRFVIYNSWVKSAVLNDITTWEQFELDADKMHQAAQTLVGQHDFSSFRAAECQAHSPVKNLKELQVTRMGDFVIVQARADGFLHHMVRNLVGVLLPIGRDRKPISWAREVLDYQDRSKGGVTAKGAGLYFIRAHYEGFDLPQLAAGPNFIQPLIDAIPNSFNAV